MFEKSWERLTTGEKDTFRRLVNSLLGHTFLTAEQYDFEEGMTRINKDYLFVERHFELFREYLDYAGFMLRRDSGYGVIYLESQSDANRVKFDKLTTLMVYTLRLIYEEEREKLTLSREVFLTTGDLVHKMVSIGAIRKKPANIVLHESLRMLLIHWYTFERELIEFDAINFLTGNNAAGKSTLVDAMQVVLLGDTSGKFFNKAASEKSDRTMRGYLYGEWGDDGEAGFTYIRKGPFTSYIVMEYEDTERKRRFMTGFVCDCFEDMNYKYRWFVTDKAGLPEDLFVDETTHVPCSLQDLKRRLTAHCGKNGFEIIDTNHRYQEVILAKFGSLKRKYLTMLRKAVPFTPIADIEKFITESICDVKNNIEIDQMQNDIRRYKSLELEAQRAQEKIEALKKIEAVTAEYENNKEKHAQQSYVAVRAELEEIRGRVLSWEKNLEEKNRRIEDLRNQLRSSDENLQLMQKHLSELETEYYGSDMVQKKKQLDKEIKDTEKEIDALFKNLILTETDVSAERRAEYERNIRRFTDYKTYLVFDLIVTNSEGEEQRLSRTLLKKSGGETQIPFYISLLRRFSLQAVFSAPPGKIGDIAPLADRNIVVYRSGR